VQRMQTGSSNTQKADHDQAPEGTKAIGERRLRELIANAVPADAGLVPLSGFKMDLSANPGFQKVFFSARCDCGTSALLSVEVAQEKTIEQVHGALPSLVDRLQSQARAFHNMPCEVHTKMRLGPALGGQ